MLRPLQACVHKNIVFIEDDGVTLATYGLALVIRSRNIKLTELPASARVIILSGYGASITTSAMHVAVSKHIEVFIASPRYGIMAMFVPSSLINASRAGLSIRRKQFEAACDPVLAVAVARAVVAAKVKAEGHARLTERAFLAALRAAKTTDDVRHSEAKAAQVWWRQWAGFELSFKGPAVAAEWRIWTGRYNRDAAGTAWRAGGSIHGAERHPPDAGDAQLCGWDCGCKDDTSCDRKGDGPLLWVLA